MSGHSGASAQPAGHGGWAGVTGKIALGVVSMLVLSVSGYAWAQYSSFDSGLRKSHILEANAGKDTNILIMGLDSRLDENGNPLPQDIYNALQAGNQNDGGNNSNVLMLLHVPGDGSKATSISVPRDDYVNFPGCPDKQCSGKIKEAYGLAFAQKHDQLVGQGLTNRVAIEQQSRDAGRQAEIDTVQQFLGGVPINHFVEVTMVAFFQIAQVVQPITVCLNEDTHDTFSGADFKKGVQQINAKQAVEFVRQRRDPNTALNFTDLDRERRQQAFISSLAYQLKQAGTFSSPGKLQGILDVGKQNIAVDDKLNLLDFAQQASNLTSGNIQFVTLPIAGNATRNGEDVNIVDVPKIQALVRQYLGGAAPPSPAAPSGQAPSHVTVDVANASGHDGLAADVEHFLAGKGYTEGTASTDSTKQSRSTIYYSGDPAAANALSGVLGGMRIEKESSLPSGHVKVVLGTDFSASTLGTSSSSNTPAGGSSAAPAGDVVSAFAGGVHDQATPAPAPAPDTGSTSIISGGGIPCVK
jgi:LCP family protein required for cell wall assembly